MRPGIHVKIDARHVLVLMLLAGAPGEGHAVEEFAGTRFYFGELHAHSGLSRDAGSADLGDCDPLGSCGDFAAYFDTARHDSGLDFAAITDHVNGTGEMEPSGWPETLTLVQDAHDPDGGFVALLGAEVEYVLEDQIPVGHKNLVLFREDIWDVPLTDLAAIGYAPACEDTLAREAATHAEYGPLLAVPHHPAPELPMSYDWSCLDPGISPVAEIYSNHGNSRDTPAVDPYDAPIFDVVPDRTLNAALSTYGHRIGIVGGTDRHDTRPGDTCTTDGHNLAIVYGGSLTGVFFDEPLSRTAIHDALKARHSFATTGPKIPVLLSLTRESGESIAVGGDEVAVAAGTVLRARVELPAGQAQHVQGVELFHSDLTTSELKDLGDGVYEAVLGAIDASRWGYAIVTLDGEAYYDELGVTCEDGGEDGTEKIWTSPVWIDLQAIDDDDSAQDDDDAGDDDTAVIDGGCKASCRADSAGQRTPLGALALALSAVCALRQRRRRGRAP